MIFKFSGDIKLFDNNGTMLSFLSLARQCQQQQQENQQNCVKQENGVAAAAGYFFKNFLIKILFNFKKTKTFFILIKNNIKQF